MPAFAGEPPFADGRRHIMTNVAHAHIPAPSPMAGDPRRPPRIALFSGNYNYVRDGANRALNHLVGHLERRGAAVRVYSPTTRTPAFAPTGTLVSIPSIGLPGRGEYRLGLGLSAAIRADLHRFAPDLIHVSAPDWSGVAAVAIAGRPPPQRAGEAKQRRSVSANCSGVPQATRST